MSNFHQGSSPKDAHRQLGKPDEELKERHSSQVHSSSNNNQDEDFSEEHSPLMNMRSENKIQQRRQQEPQLINGAPFQQGYPLNDSDSKENCQILSHSQQQTLVTSPQGYSRKDGSPPNHQSSCPDLQQQQFSTKISISQEHSSKGNYHHLPQQKSIAGATLAPSPQQQPSPISAPSAKNNYPQENNQSSHQSQKQPSPVTAPSERQFSEDDYTAGSQNSKNLQHQQPSDGLQGVPAKQAHPPKHSRIPTGESNTSSGQQDSKIDHDPHKSQSSSIKHHSAQRHAAPLKSEERKSVNQKTVTKKKDEARTKKGAKMRVDSSDKNIRVPRTQLKSSTHCKCSIL